jgi:glycosyltransferase involved in cell wall biosynthesis
MLGSMADQIPAWIYTADKNLTVFSGKGAKPESVFKINNAMPRDKTPSPLTRKKLGIAGDAVVFTFVARGVERKGWRAVVMAFRELLRARPRTKMHLLLVGEGDKAVEATDMIGTGEPITWLGYQSQINGLYRISDCAVVPTRFAGESNPLCLIQALQEGLPVIATNIGEIRNMLDLDGKPGGLILEPKRDTAVFAHDVMLAMRKMLDKRIRTQFRQKSRKLSAKFDLAKMIDDYDTVFHYAVGTMQQPSDNTASET